METFMADETKTPQSNQSKPTPNNRSNQNRSNNRHRNNRPQNRPHAPAKVHANPFEVEATYHTTKADYWRKRVNGFAAFTLIYCALTLSLANMASGAQNIISFGLITFTLIFLTVNSARSYHNHKKNAALNKFRQNILITAEDMAKATKDQVTKEEFMLEALTSIGSSNKSN